MLKTCSALQEIQTGVRIHGQATRLNLENDVCEPTKLVGFYVKCGCLLEASKVFDGMLERDVEGCDWTGFRDGARGGELNWTTVLAVLPVTGTQVG